MSKPKSYEEAKLQVQTEFDTFTTPCVFCVRVTSASRMMFAKALKDIENIPVKEAAARVKACKEEGSDYEIWIWNDYWSPAIFYGELKLAHEISGALTLMGLDCEIVTKFDIEHHMTDAGMKRKWKIR